MPTTTTRTPGTRRRTTSEPPTRLDAPDLDATHDPGPGRRARRGSRPPRRSTMRRASRSQGPAGHPIRVGTASWTDPTMTASGVFYPTAADTAEERLQLLRVPVPGGRGRRHVLRPAVRRLRAVGRADAARLRVRHQGPRAAHRPAHRDEAAAEGDPGCVARELQAKPRLYAKDLPGELREEVWAPVRRRARAARGVGQLGAVFLQYPKWFFTARRAARPDPPRRTAAHPPYGLLPRRRVPQRDVVQREEHRADAALPRATRASRW